MHMTCPNQERIGRVRCALIAVATPFDDEPRIVFAGEMFLVRCRKFNQDSPCEARARLRNQSQREVPPVATLNLPAINEKRESGPTTNPARSLKALSEALFPKWMTGVLLGICGRDLNRLSLIEIREADSDEPVNQQHQRKNGKN